MTQNPFSIRAKIAAPYLRGRGAEIGAGVSPQALPPGTICEIYDKRTKAELALLFNVEKSEVPDVYPIEVFQERNPEGVDFLIAHNVLEHISNPVAQLIKLNSFVKSGGVAVLSVPHLDYCPDRGRLVPSFEHLLADYLLDRGDYSFESREHVYSFMMGWIDDGIARGLNKFDIAALTHECAKAQTNDLHWHAFNEELLKKMIEAAAIFGRKDISIMARGTPYQDDSEFRTMGDIIYVYRVQDARRNPLTRGNEVLEEMQKLLGKLREALQKIDEASMGFL